MRNPYFVSRPYSCEFIEGERSAERLRRTGSNTGNLLFIHALKRVVRHERYSCGVKLNPSSVREQHDGLIVPAANWLKPNAALGKLAHLVESSKLPCVMVGLGAQATSYDRVPALDEGTVRLVRVIAERSHSISVRGQFSAEVLNHYGVKNVTVTGCPSMLWQVRAPVAVRRNGPDRPARVTVGTSRAGTTELIRTQTVRNRLSILLSAAAMKHGWDYVAQTEVHDIGVATSEISDAAGREQAAEYLRLAFQTSDDSAISDYLQRHLKVFFRIPDWPDYAVTRDFIFGTRLHGVIIGLIAGVPSLLLTHDTRTEEAAQWMGLPSVSATTVLQAKKLDLQRLYESIDLDSLNSRMQKYYAEFRRFFELNNVETNLVTT